MNVSCILYDIENDEIKSSKNEKNSVKVQVKCDTPQALQMMYAGTIQASYLTA
jgi:predicted Fe-Mo cluster-binding NifX family protein